MFILNFIFSEFAPHILYSSIPQPVDSNNKGILMLEDTLELPANYFCVGTASDFFKLARQTGQEPVGTYFLTGSESDLDELKLYSCNLILCGLSLGSLYNRIFCLTSAWNHWAGLLESGQDNSLRQIFKKSSMLINASICIMNSSFKIITASVRQKDTQFFQNFDDSGSDAQKILENLLSQPFSASVPVYWAQNRDTVHALMPLSVENEFLGFLYGCMEDSLVQLQKMLIAIAYQLTVRLQNPLNKHTSLSFLEIARLLFLSPPEDFEHIQIMLQNLPKAPQKYMRLILIQKDREEGENGFASLKELYQELSSLFVNDNLVILDNSVLILISSKFASCALTAPSAGVEEVLKHHQASAVISHACSTAKALRISYLKCCILLPIILKVRLDGSKRLCYFGRYSMYMIIDLCAKHMKDLFDTDDIIYLCSPAVLTLTRYDQAYDCNLRDVLFTYLMNDRSIAETSKLMYMHRNTAIYKINKIKELIHRSLDDPYYRFQLIFSCMLIRYYENCQNHTLVLTPFIRDDYRP